MPIYEYKCDTCGTKFEKLMRRAADTDGLACPDCGEKHLSQQYSTFAARAAEGGSAAASDMPSCPSGMCSNPGFCGRN
jgi:putative FmdB family regulatory protein